MSELRWLPEYSGETTSELIALERAFRKDSVIAAFEQALEEKAHRIGGIGLLTGEERVVLAVVALEREVNNGGYDQFLLNTNGELVEEADGALERIGRGDLARLTRRAIDIAKSHVRSQADLPSADGVEADSEYYQVAGDLAEPLFEFIKQIQERIILP